MTDLPRARSARGNDDASLTAGAAAGAAPDEPDTTPHPASPDELDAAIARSAAAPGAAASTAPSTSDGASAHDGALAHDGAQQTGSAQHIDRAQPADTGRHTDSNIAEHTGSAQHTGTAQPTGSSQATGTAQHTSTAPHTDTAPHADPAQRAAAAPNPSSPRPSSPRTDTAPRPGTTTPGRGARLRDAFLVGLAGLIVSGAFLWVPSVWYDEAATVTSATRGFGQLWRMVQDVDAVHAAYYSLMHLWFDLVGYSPLMLRLPSAICIGIASGLVVWLGGRLVTHRIAVVAGILFFLMPRVAWMGTEGRSFALTTLIAVALTLVLVLAVRSRRRVWPWVIYAVLAVAGVAVFAYLALLIAAHGVTVLWWALTRLRGRERALNTARVVGSFLVAAGVAGAAAVPLVLAIRAQSAQVSWISPISDATRGQVFTTQFFTANPVLAWIGWPLGVIGVLILAWGGWARFRSPGKPGGAAGAGLTLLQVSVPWIAVPLAGLIVASELVSPLYSPRYLAFTAPGLALLMAVPLVAVLRKKWQIALAVTVIAAVAAPAIVAQRLPEAKDNSSWAEVAALIERERASETVGTKDAVIFGPVRRHPTATARVIAITYPDAFEGMIDVNLDTPGPERGTLWESIHPLSERLDVADQADVIYLVTSNKRDWRPGVTERLATLGFSVSDEWNLTGVNVLRFTRVASDGDADADAPTRGAPPEGYVEPGSTPAPTAPAVQPTPLPGEPGSSSAPTR